MRDLQRMLVSKFENIGFVINNYSASCVYKGKNPIVPCQIFSCRSRALSSKNSR